MILRVFIILIVILIVILIGLSVQVALVSGHVILNLSFMQTIGRIAFNQANEHGNNILKSLFTCRDLCAVYSVLCCQQIQASSAMQRRASGVVEEATAVRGSEFAVAFGDVQ